MEIQKTAIQPESNIAAERPPVVVVLGHVDHGKTTLLDAIRQTDVASREYGGITQSIGAYQISLPDKKKITFIDTPGHEAFTKMRSRGAGVADIAVLVVAANDSVMPQTAESIKIIQAAKIPYVVAINKIDLPEANIDKVIQDLLRYNVLLENYGGDVPFLKISARKKDGLKELLDLIELLAEVSGVTGEEADPLDATVIEAKLDKNRGPVATVVVRNGSLSTGQEIYIDGTKSKIRALIDFQGKPMAKAGPGTPAEILGLKEVPAVGSTVSRTATPVKTPKAASQTLASGGELKLILKGDNAGSLEAITAVLPDNVHLIDLGSGEITEADILLAKSTGAIVLGFNIKAGPSALKLAETERVLVRTYKIIYELLDEVRDAARGVLEPEPEEILGRAQILASFPYEKMLVAGSRILEGRLARGDTVKILRHGAGGEETVGQSRIKSLRVGKDDINKVEAGKECGVLLEPQIDFRPGDVIASHKI